METNALMFTWLIARVSVWMRLRMYPLNSTSSRLGSNEYGERCALVSIRECVRVSVVFTLQNKQQSSRCDVRMKLRSACALCALARAICVVHHCYILHSATYSASSCHDNYLACRLQNIRRKCRECGVRDVDYEFTIFIPICFFW